MTNFAIYTGSESTEPAAYPWWMCLPQDTQDS